MERGVPMAIVDTLTGACPDLKGEGRGGGGGVGGGGGGGACWGRGSVICLASGGGIGRPAGGGGATLVTVEDSIARHAAKKIKVSLIRSAAQLGRSAAGATSPFLGTKPWAASDGLIAWFVGFIEKTLQGCALLWVCLRRDHCQHH